VAGKCLMGVETEYAVRARKAGGWTEHGAALLPGLLASVRRIYRTLPDAFGGVFMENGSRLYVDYGSHPELATAECADPWELVRYVLAGERILARAADTFGGRGGAGLDLFKCNVDYSGSLATWGCHESYLLSAPPGGVSHQLIPHLASRVVYTGAGGFDARAPGLRFTISPRASHIERAVSEGSTGGRGIFHTKDEPLAGKGFRRLHVICGESVCSQTASWLKVGATALVVALAERGLGPGASTALADPVAAMRAFAADTSCRARALLTSGVSKTALEIQHAYLRLAEEHAGASFMPEWAGEVCRVWRRTLERLAEGPDAVAATLDWAVKLALYRAHARRAGFEWDSLPRWSHAYGLLPAALGVGAEGLSARVRLGARPAAGAAAHALESYLKKNGLDWAGLEAFARLREQLLELDTKFGQLGGRGLFAQLEAAGVLRHEVEGVGDVEAAERNPPATGRARVRGEFVRRHGGGAKYVCDWAAVWSQESQSVLDLSDPFETAERWLSHAAYTAAAGVPQPPADIYNCYY
jgi:proteasome accessory factor A